MKTIHYISAFSTVLASVTLTYAREIVVSHDGRGEFSSIAAAAAEAKAGDIVVVEPGIYRETVLVQSDGVEGSNVVFRSRVRGAAVVTGSEIWRNPWREWKGRVVASPIDVSKFAGGVRNPYLRAVSINPVDEWKAARPYTNGIVSADTQLPKTLGQIFVDGEQMTEATSLRILEEGENTWMVSPDGKEILVHPSKRLEPLAERTIEWTVRERVFAADRRERRFVTVSGFSFRHCANQGPFPQYGMVDTCSGKDWTIEHNEIAYAKTIGLAIGCQSFRRGEDMPDVPPDQRGRTSGDRHLVRFNHVHDNGLSGIAGIRMSGVQILNNIVERNHREVFGFPEITWFEMGGIKLHCSDTLIAGNIVRDNDGFGIWLDTNYAGSRITGNLVLNNAAAGIFFESDFGNALADNNIVAFTRSTSKRFPGDGIYSHNGSCVTVAHNLILANSGAGVRFRVVRRSKIRGADPACATNRFCNNIFFNNSRGTVIYPSQEDVVAGTVFSGNMYLGNDHERGEQPGFMFDGKEDLAGWTGSLKGATPEEWSAPYGWDRDSLCTRDIDTGRATNVLDMPPGGNIEVDSYNLMMRMSLPARFDNFMSRAIDGLGSDYRGRPYPAAGKRVKPGPFQDVRFADTRISIMPYSRESVQSKENR